MSYEKLIGNSIRIYGGSGCGCVDLATLKLFKGRELYIECFICGNIKKLGNVKRGKENTIAKLEYLLSTGAIKEESPDIKRERFLKKGLIRILNKEKSR